MVNQISYIDDIIHKDEKGHLLDSINVIERVENVADSNGEANTTKSHPDEMM